MAGEEDKVEFPFGMDVANEITGDDWFYMASKNGKSLAAQWNKAKEYLNITGIELEPLVGGTTSGTALVVPAGPAGENRKAQVRPGWYDFGGGPVEATADKQWTAFWNGSTWSLIDMGELPQQTKTKKVEKNNTDVVESDGVFNAVDNLANLNLSLPIPHDKSDELFDTGNLSVGSIYWDGALLFKKGETLKNTYLKGKISGDVKILIVTVSGSTSTVFSSVQKSFVLGVNKLSDLVIAYPDSDYHVAISPLTANSIGYKSEASAQGKVSPVDGGAVSNTTASFPYWIEKKYAIEELNTVKAQSDQVANMTGTPVDIPVPYDKSGVALTANGASTLRFGSDLAWFGKSRPLKSVNIFNRVAGGQIRISFVEIVGTTATILYESGHITLETTGVKTIPLSSLSGVPAGINNKPRVQVFIGNETYTTTSSFGYRNAGAGNGEKYHNINKSTGALTTTESTASAVILGYWLTVEEMAYPNIVQEVQNIKASISYPPNNYQLLLDAIANQDEIRLHGKVDLEGTLNIPAGKKIIGDGTAVLKLGSGVTTGVYLNESYGTVLDRFTIDGGASQLDILTGSILPVALDLEGLTGNGTKKGLHVVRGDGVIVNKLKFKNLDSFGFFMELTGDLGPSGGDYRFTEGLSMNDCFAVNCYMGYRMGNGAQYSRFSNIKAINSICGISVCGGNITVSNGQFDKNRVGAHVGNGTNNAHGSFVGGTMNHNVIRGLLVANITNGHVFSGVNFFDGHIEIYNSIGVIISGSLVASEITATLNANQGAMISNNTFRSDGGYNTGVINKSGAGKLTLAGNTFTSGKDASSINGVL